MSTLHAGVYIRVNKYRGDPAKHQVCISFQSLGYWLFSNLQGKLHTNQDFQASNPYLLKLFTYVKLMYHLKHTVSISTIIIPNTFLKVSIISLTHTIHSNIQNIPPHAKAQQCPRLVPETILDQIRQMTAKL